MAEEVAVKHVAARPTLTVAERARRELRGIAIVAQREMTATLFTPRLAILLTLFGLAMFSYTYFRMTLSVEFGGTIDLGADPDTLLAELATNVVASVGTLAAITLSYDSISREKAENSLLLLLSRPVSRRGIALGKYLGVLGAWAVPMMVITYLVLPVIASLSREGWPSAGMAANFILLSVVLVGTYVALQQTISTLAKTTGTAILSGIAVWIVFNLLFRLLVLLGAAALGPGNLLPGGIISNIPAVRPDIADPAALLNPGSVMGGTFNLVFEISGDLRGSRYYVSLEAVFAALGAWFLGSLLLFLEVFHRRATS